MGSLFQDIQKDLKLRYDLWQAKVHVISFPKSGRTWLSVLTGKAICEMYGLDDRNALDSLGLTRAAGLLPTIYTHDGSSNTGGRHYRKLSADKSAYRKKKVLLLVREPRDTVVSCYFQATQRRKLFQGTISEFIRHDHYGIRKILTFYDAWERNQSVPKEFLALRYEEMHRDPAAALRAALAFMGARDVDDAVVAKAVDFASFSNMKKMEAEGYFTSNKLKPRDPKDEASFKTRKGQVGGYTNYLSPEDCAYAQSVIDELGCPFYGIPPCGAAKASNSPI